jgi:hypothetical protein
MPFAQAIRSHPQAGGISGRVVLDWEEPPPNFLKGLGSCFAEQDLGEAACEIDGMVGAGMVVRRRALVECGWLHRPLLADRIGKRLVSGGDCGTYCGSRLSIVVYAGCSAAASHLQKPNKLAICSLSCMGWVEANRE